MTAIKILLIDDDNLVRSIIAGAMRKKGFDVTEAQDGDAALELFQNKHFDICVTDMVMPGKSGSETIKDLRAYNPLVKIIAMSSDGENQKVNFLEVAHEAGADMSFKKPFSPCDLELAIRKIL